MKQLDIESQFILYFLRDQNRPIKRREIESRYPRMTKSRINYRLDKMKNMGLIRKKKHQEYGHGVNPTYEWMDVPSQVEQYEAGYSQLATPAWKWKEFSDKWFDTFEKRLKRIENQI